MPQVITERTLIPISLVVGILAGVAWSVRLEARVDKGEASTQTQFDNNIKRLDRQSEFIQEVSRTMSRIDSRLSRIEGKLGVEARE